MQFTGDVVQNSMLETFITLLTPVSPINLFQKTQKDVISILLSEQRL